MNQLFDKKTTVFLKWKIFKKNVWKFFSEETVVPTFHFRLAIGDWQLAIGPLLNLITRGFITIGESPVEMRFNRDLIAHRQPKNDPKTKLVTMQYILSLKNYAHHFTTMSSKPKYFSLKSNNFYSGFSGDGEYILNKIIRDAKRYGYLEHMCMNFLKQNVLEDKRHLWITFLSEISWEICQLLMNENCFSSGKTMNFDFLKDVLLFWRPSPDFLIFLMYNLKFILGWNVHGLRVISRMPRHLAAHNEIMFI